MLGLELRSQRENAHLAKPLEGRSRCPTTRRLGQGHRGGVHRLRSRLKSCCKDLLRPGLADRSHRAGTDSGCRAGQGLAYGARAEKGHLGKQIVEAKPPQRCGPRTAVACTKPNKLGESEAHDLSLDRDWRLAWRHRAAPIEMEPK